MTEEQAWLLLGVLCVLGLGTGRDGWTQTMLAIMGGSAFALAAFGG